MNNGKGMSSMDNYAITEDMLTMLRKRIGSSVSHKRFEHILGVERMVAKLAEIYMPDELQRLRAAALLHDATKEYSVEKNLQIYKRCGIPGGGQDVLAPKIMHAKTAAALIPEMFPEFDDPFIISAVRWHTTGRENMQLHEKLLYLADYIDDTRKYKDCEELRDYFFSFDFDNVTDNEKRLEHLDKTLVLSFKYTIQGLLEEDIPLCMDTVLARNDLLAKRAEHAKK